MSEPLYPDDGIDWIPVIARVRKEATGEIREMEGWRVWREKDGRVNPYIFSEGNASCDCNRCAAFDEESECGDKAYSVQVLAADDRRILYDEFDTPIDQQARNR